MIFRACSARAPLVRRALMLVVAAVVLAGGGRGGGDAAVSAEPAVTAKLTYLGQSCFLLESAGGTRVVMDPFAKGIGYELPVGLRADAVTVSHEHADHNNVGMVAGRPRVLRGLTADRKGWTKIDERVKDVSIRTVGVYHDDVRGAARGPVAVFIFEVGGPGGLGGLRIAHLGDLGHALDDKQLGAIGSVDVVLVPVGGAVTIDAAQATRVIDQLRPRLLVVPMHYKTPASTVTQLGTLDDFLAGKANVRRLTGNVLPLSPLKSRPASEIVVMGYR